MVKAVLFDLGGTLAAYYTREQFPAILREALGNVGVELAQRGLDVPSGEELARRAQEEDHGSPDFRVRPLEERLARIAGLSLAGAPELSDALCRAFMRPIFALSRVYDDTLPVLGQVRAAGYRMALVSNSPWGSPAALWREEIDRLGLRGLFDATVFCGDAGWRKPARPIFDLALAQLTVGPQEAVFVGDDPRWDLVGPRALGMRAILVDRLGQHRDGGEEALPDLRSLLACL